MPIHLTIPLSRPPRTLIAFLENNLKVDGTIAIPEPLRMYMGGKSVIE